MVPPRDSPPGRGKRPQGRWGGSSPLTVDYPLERNRLRCLSLQLSDICDCVEDIAGVSDCPPTKIFVLMVAYELDNARLKSVPPCPQMHDSQILVISREILWTTYLNMQEVGTSKLLAPSAVV